MDSICKNRYNKSIEIKNKKAKNRNDFLISNLIDVKKQISEEKNHLKISILNRKREDLISKILSTNNALIWDLINQIVDKNSIKQSSLEDIYHEGISGFLHALDRFDQNRNIQFSTYASFCISGYIKKYINNSQIIPLPSHKVGEMAAARRGEDKYFVKKDQKFIDINPIIKSLSYGQKYISDIDVFHNSIKDTKDYEDGVLDNFSFSNMINCLDEEEKDIIQKIYIDGYQISDLVKLNNYSYNKLKNKYNKILKKIRNNMEPRKSNIKHDMMISTYTRSNSDTIRRYINAHCKDNEKENVFLFILKIFDINGIFLFEMYHILKSIYIDLNKNDILDITLNLIKNNKIYSNIPLDQIELDSSLLCTRICLKSQEEILWSYTNEDNIYNLINNRECNLNEINMENKFRKNTVRNFLYNILKTFDQSGISMSSICNMINIHFGIDCNSKTIKIIREWTINNYNNFYFLYDQFPIYKDGKSYYINEKAIVSICNKDKKIPYWSRNFLILEKYDKINK